MRICINFCLSGGQGTNRVRKNKKYAKNFKQFKEREWGFPQWETPHDFILYAFIWILVNLSLSSDTSETCFTTLSK